MNLRHYGSWVYDEGLFEPIRDIHWTKPGGGLWTSPLDSEHSWERWCLAENFSECDTYFDLTFEGRVFTIDSLCDLEKFQWIRDTQKKIHGMEYPSFEALLPDYDAVHLTVQGEIDTRFSRPHNLYGWDCESVLVMNKECIWITS